MKKILIFLIFTLLTGYLFAQTPLYLRNKTVTQVWGLDTNTVILYGDSTWYYSNEPLYLDYPAYYLDDFAVGGNDSLVLFVNGTSGKIDTLPYNSISGSMGMDSATIAGTCWTRLRIDSITGCSPVVIFDGTTYYHFTDSTFTMKTASEDTLLMIGNSDRVFQYGLRDTTTGQYTLGVGTDLKTSGDYDVAIGKTCKATGNTSFALGDNSQASGSNAFSLGTYTEATGNYSLAMGYYTDATNSYSIAMGDNSISTGIASFAGGRAKANGLRSFAWGDSTRVEGDHDIGLGYNNKLLGAQRNVGIGYNNTLNDSAQVLIGSENAGTAWRCYGIGDNNTLTGGTNSAFAGGVSNTVAVGGAGYTAIGIGSGNTATGSIAIGNSNSATGWNGSVAIGISNSTNGNNTNVIGFGNTANVDQSNIMGYQSVVSAAFGNVIGYKDTVSGYGGFATGVSSSARDTCAVAFGRFDKSQGKYSLTGGYSNAASGDFSVAWGYNNTIGAAFDYSYVFGSGLTADHAYTLTSHNLQAVDTVFIGDSSYVIEETDTLRIYTPKVVKLGANSLKVLRDGSVQIDGNLAVNGELSVTDTAMMFGELSYQDTTGTTIALGKCTDFTDNTQYVNLGPTTALTSENNSSMFDNGGANDGHLRYTGSETKQFHCGATFSFTPVGANDQFYIAIAKNDTIIVSSWVEMRGGNAGDIRSSALHQIVTLSTNDEISIRVANRIDGDDMDILSINLFAVGM